MITNISKFDRLIFWLYQLMSRIQSWFIALLSGFFLGRVAGELSLPHTNWLDVLKGLFYIADHPANFLTWLSLTLLAATPLSSYILAKLHRRRQYEKILTSLVQRHKDSSIAPFNVIGWNGAVSLQTCPELHRGWQASEVRLDHDTTRFTFPKEYEEPYQKYFEKCYQEKRFFDDRVKIMLTDNPIAFFNSPTLLLKTQETLYSQTHFYRDNVATLIPKRDELIRKVFNELHILFPHSLCLHATVVTKDKKVLITKRSLKVAYFPGTWSCSAEEQLSHRDVEESPDRVMLKCFKRLLQEELRLGSETYNENNLRILSVFLLSDDLGICVCGHAVLDIDSAELNQIIESLPRTDYEFTEWVFLTHKELLDELFHPTRPYHPTSGYRMLLTLIKRYGESRVAAEFFSRDKK